MMPVAFFFLNQSLLLACLGCFQFVSIINNSAPNMLVFAPLCMDMRVSLGRHCEMEMLGQGVHIFDILAGAAKLTSRMVVWLHMPTIQCLR